MEYTDVCVEQESFWLSQLIYFILLKLLPHLFRNRKTIFLYTSNATKQSSSGTAAKKVHVLHCYEINGSRLE